MSTSTEELSKLFESELYLYFHEDFLDNERTEKECEFIKKNCEFKEGDKILDLACGHGRHSNYLAAENYKVYGIDINRRFIELSKESAKLQELEVEYIEQNILEIEYEEEFNQVLLLFNTIGFFDKADNKKLLRKIHKALKIGGKLIIDTKNRDHIIKELKRSSITEKNQDLMIDRVKFDPKTGKTLNERIYIKGGKRYDTPFSMNTYNYGELEMMVTELGFRRIKVFGDWNESEFNQDSRRIILILEKIK